MMQPRRRCGARGALSRGAGTAGALCQAHSRPRSAALTDLPARPHTAAPQLLKYLVSQGLPPADLAAQRDSSIPSSNLQMLLMLATKDPATLHALGATPQVGVCGCVGVKVA